MQGKMSEAIKILLDNSGNFTQYKKQITSWNIPVKKATKKTPFPLPS